MHLHVIVLSIVYRVPPVSIMHLRYTNLLQPLATNACMSVYHSMSLVFIGVLARFTKLLMVRLCLFMLLAMQVLLHGTSQAKGDILLTLAKCVIMTTAAASQPHSAAQQQQQQQHQARLQTAIQHLNRAAMHFKLCHAMVPLRESLYLLARLYDAQGAVEQRDTVAVAFSRVDAFISSSGSALVSHSVSIGTSEVKEYMHSADGNVPW
jgi:hypothetical protein